MVKFGERVKQLRLSAGMTQEQLAELIDVSPQYISDLERGVVGISIATLRRLCEKLRISSDQILFSRKPENDVSALTEKCGRLPREQFEILSTIIQKFIEAMNMKLKQ